MLTPKIPVAKEGYPFIGYSAFVTLVLAVLGYTLLSLVMVFLTTFVLSFFRDPERFIPEDDSALVSPADGKVIIVEDVHDTTFMKQDCKKISVFMNVFNVHVNRIPFGGTVEKILYKPGKFYNAESQKGALENEYCASFVTTNRGQKIVFVQIAGLIARRIICWLENEDIVKKGERFGLIRFGSRVDLYLPAEATVNIKVGDKVRAGETILAHLPE